MLNPQPLGSRKNMITTLFCLCDTVLCHCSVHFARDSVTMCPPAYYAPADMVFNGSVEQAFMYLEKLKHNHPLPNHVIDLNPYKYRPCNLPGEMWYWFTVCSAEKNRTEFGFWRPKEAPCEIFTNSDRSGWRTTSEFIDTQHGQPKITDWVMQEYKITEKGPCSDKIERESRAICSVFLSDRKNPNLEVHPNTREAVTLHRNGIHSVAPIVPRIDTVNNGVDSGLLVSEANGHLDPQMEDIVEHELESGEYVELDDLADPLSLSPSSDHSSGLSFTMGNHEYFDPEALLRELESDNNQNLQSSSFNVNNVVDSRLLVSEADRHWDPQIRNIAGHHLELDDLADPLSLSTSSNNSSRTSFSFEYFDPEALLRELESDNNQSLQAKSNSSCSATASAKPLEMLMQPATSGSLVCAKDTDERVPDHTVKLEKQEKKGDPSCSAGVASSSNSGALVSTGKRKAAGVKIKALKKYFCFMP